MSWWSELVAVFKSGPEAKAPAPVSAPEPAGQVVIDVLKFSPAPKPAMGDVAEDERRMLAAIQSGDDHGREIYADWLEAQDRVVEAEYVRAELGVGAARGGTKTALREALDRFAFAGRRVSTDFKAYLSRPTIERCLSFELKCPLRWDRLALTADARVRSCDVCQKSVRFCETVDEARRVASGGGCVAIELSRPRRQGDLEPTEQVMMMGRVSSRQR